MYTMRSFGFDSVFHILYFAFTFTTVSDVVIIMKLAAGTQNELPYKEYISDFSYSDKWQNDTTL